MPRNDRQRKSQSLTAATLSAGDIHPSTSQPLRKSRPITMFFHGQDKQFSPTTETDGEADGASVNSHRTSDTNQESVSSDTADHPTDPPDIVKFLCDIDGGLNVILERVRQAATSSKEATTFLKKRAAIEEEYGKAMIKIAKSGRESYYATEFKRGTFGDNWLDVMRIHESVGENRCKFATAIQDIAEELSTQLKDIDKGRKNLKDASQRHERAIQEAEQSMEKAKVKYETHSEDWERSILEKNGDAIPSSKRSLSKAIFTNKAKTPGQLLKQEEEARVKAATANKNYKMMLANTNATRHEYYNVHLPRMITDLKNTACECDEALKYHLTRYSYLYEHTMVSDALAVSPVKAEDGLSLRKTVEAISNEDDFHAFVAQYGARARKVKRNEIEYNEYSMSELAQNIMNPKTIFGVPLATQLERDGQQVPLVLVKCAEAIERYGLESQGIYRISGTKAQTQSLKSQFDRNAELVDLNSEEALVDINNVASVLKLWFRELPDPLFTNERYHDFVNASKIDDSNMRIITLHELINDLPDPNYSTLKYLMGHLDTVVAHQHANKMTVQNISIVFGPTLMGMGPPPSSSTSAGPSNQNASINDALPPLPASPADPNGGGFNDMGWQCRVVETILENYRHIFVQDDEYEDNDG